MTSGVPQGSVLTPVVWDVTCEGLIDTYLLTWPSSGSISGQSSGHYNSKANKQNYKEHKTVSVVLISIEVHGTGGKLGKSKERRRYVLIRLMSCMKCKILCAIV